MQSATGIKPPLHRRFNEEQALDQIRGRYRRCRDTIAVQVTALQQDHRFCTQADGLYGRQYKDWMILMGVFNEIVNQRLVANGVNLLDRATAPRAIKKFSEQVLVDALPVEQFLGSRFERALDGFNSTALITWGFHPRLQQLDLKVVERFLRDRLNHFEYDLPHEPLFGDPLGDWPDTNDTQTS